MAFNIADVLKSAAAETGGKKQIEYIPREQIHRDSRNFYSTEGIEDLAANIQLAGLQQPLVVRPEGEGFTIVSGHRRSLALDLLYREEPEKWASYPCIVERDSVSPEMQELRLILANSATRDMSSADKARQTERLTELFYALKNQGVEFPGKMRKYVAEACQISETRLAKLKVIRSRLDPAWVPDYEGGKLSEDAAYHMARLTPSIQRLYKEVMEKLDPNGEKTVSSWQIDEVAKADNRNAEKKKCPEAVCSNRMKIVQWAMVDQHGKGYLSYCPGCCKGCENLATCHFTCAPAAEERKALQAQAKEDRAEEKAAKERSEALAETHNREKIAFVLKGYRRILAACQQSGVSLQAFADTASRYPGTTVNVLEKVREEGFEPNSYSDLPYHFRLDTDAALHLVAAADLLGCSTDFLLGREERCSNATPAQVWQTGTPDWDQDGEYACWVLLRGNKHHLLELTWDGEEWYQGDVPFDYPVVKWCRIPEFEE